MSRTFDAIILGGGPGGATAALLLARAGWSVAVIERARFPRRKVCGEYVSATNLPLFRRLGLAEDFLRLAGPPVRRVGLFAAETMLSAAMPRRKEMPDAFGRALGRELLDTMLLDHASSAGARVWQPWSATRLEKQSEVFLCEATNREKREVTLLRAKLVIAAHGSWEPGSLPTQPTRPARRSRDLLGFKAHFRDGSLAAGLMPLLVLPGGYGGMVHTNDDRLSLSCCIRRDQLERARRARPNRCAADALWEHLIRSCRGAREALAGARLDGGWLSTGPIRPGIRPRCCCAGVFAVGNAAGEAHPIIAEGISMAVQSAWLLCDRLDRAKNPLSNAALREVGEDYSRAWRRSFVARMQVAACLAHLAMQPAAVGLLLPLLRLFPPMLTWGAGWSGKASDVATTSGEAGFRGSSGV